MREKIEAMAQERYARGNGTVQLSQRSIVLVLEPDSRISGEFRAAGTDGARMRGRIYTSHWRMKTEQVQIDGPAQAVNYTFDSTGMLPGDTVRGEFVLSTDLGEYYLPFAATACYQMAVTAMGTIRTVGGFVTLANLDREGAFAIFASPAFQHILDNDRPVHRQWFDGFVGERGLTMEAMEAFLAMQPGYEPGEPEEEPEEDLNTFIRQAAASNVRRQQRQLEIQLYKLYLRFRGMQISVEQWAKESLEIIDSLMQHSRYRKLYIMLQIHVLLISGEREEAGRSLDAFVDNQYDLKKNDELYGYYLYLSAMKRNSKPFLEQVCQRVRVLYQRHPKSRILLWVLLMTDQSLLMDYREKLHLMEEQYHMGVCSPLLLIEACMLYRQNPALLTKLSDYNLQVLTFACKQELFSDEMMRRLAELAAQNKNYSPRLLELLVRCYGMGQEKEVLKAICVLLIKGNKTGERYFRWYAEGVAKNLHITRLYDFYLYSLAEDMDKPIPSEVMMYFRYNQDLHHRKKAFIFANLLKYKKEYNNLYDDYKEDMREFVRYQLDRGRMDCYMADLYRHMLDDSLVTEENASHVLDFLCARRLEHLPDEFKTVIVRDSALQNESVWQVSHGEAMVPLYSENCCVFLKDRKGNRSGLSEPEKLPRWFERDKLWKHCARLCPDHPAVVLQRCRDLMEGKTVSWQKELETLCSHPVLSVNYRLYVWQQVTDYFYRTYDMEGVNWCLDFGDISRMPTPRLHDCVELLLHLGRYEEAFGYILVYGWEHLAPKLLVRMCSRLICKNEFIREENLLKVTRQLFLAGRYDEVMLTYLVDFLEAGTRELLLLWQAAKKFEMDTRELEGRLLQQMLYTEYLSPAVYDVFDSYMNDEEEDLLEQAFLTYVSREMLQRDLVPEPRFYRWLGRALTRGDKLNDACRLAWLYGLSQGNAAQLSEGETAKATQIVAELKREGRYMGFFARLPAHIIREPMVAEKTYITYKDSPNRRIFCHYHVEGADDGQVFTTVEMEQPYPGIYVLEYTLFSGERLCYYLTDKTDQEEKILISGRQDAGESGGSGFYGKLNTLLNQSGNARQQLAETYARELAVVRRGFVPL